MFATANISAAGSRCMDTMIGCIMLIFLLWVSAAGGNFFQAEPLGFKMCERLCIHFSKCFVYHFEVSELSCSIYRCGGRSHNLPQDANNTHQCPRTFRIVTSRSGRTRCVPVFNEIERRKRNSLLIVLLTRDSFTIQQFDPGTFDHKLYIRKNISEVSSMVHVTALNRFFIARMGHYKSIISMDVQTQETTILLVGRIFTALAIDISSGRLFAGFINDQGSTSVKPVDLIRHEIKEDELCPIPKGVATKIFIQQKKKIFYLISFDFPATIDYCQYNTSDGERGTIHINNTEAAHIDIPRDTLYLSDRTRVIKTKLKNQGTQVTLPNSLAISDLVMQEGTGCVFGIRQNKVCILGMVGHETSFCVTMFGEYVPRGRLMFVPSY